MRVHEFITRFVILLISTLSLTAEGADSNRLYVQIKDLVPEGDEIFTGADIDAVELSSPNGMVRLYASALIENNSNSVTPDHADQASALLGPPVLISSEAPYVKSLNGGSVSVAIDTLGLQVSPDWNLTVYEVDGTLYDEGAPEPYQIAVSRDPSGPWRDLGIGSGITRLALAGQQKLQLSDQETSSLSSIVSTVDHNIRLPESLGTIVSAEEFRLHLANSPQQIIAELKAFLVYYEHHEHQVEEHGATDNGGLQATARIMALLAERLEQLQK